MRRVLWWLASGFLAIQAVAFVALLIWPATGDMQAVLARLDILFGFHFFAAQAVLGLPLLAGLIWGAKSGTVRALLALCLVAAGMLALAPAVEIEVMNRAEPPATPLSLLLLAHWVEAALGLVALALLQLAWRAERLR